MDEMSFPLLSEAPLRSFITSVFNKLFAFIALKSLQSLKL